MKTMGTYFQNSESEPLKYGEINLINPPRQRLRGEEKLTGIEAFPVFNGFCGTDFELMKMGRAGNLDAKFPEGEKRLINGHEGVVWVPSENRFAIVLIRGGDSYDPTRYTEDETYFEYGCDGADGLFCDKNYFNPQMLLHLPEKYGGLEKLPLSLAKNLYSPTLMPVRYSSMSVWKISVWHRISVWKWQRENAPLLRLWSTQERVHLTELSFSVLVQQAFS